MPDHFQDLLDAIVADKLARVNALLEADPTLASRTLEGKARYEPDITHWVYVGDTALHVAAAGYRVEMAKTLVSTGADVGAARNQRRGQPLHYAADGFPGGASWNPDRQVAMIQLLIESGADVHAQDRDGATPLHRAVRTRCVDAVRILLESGADATRRNKPGSTPFHLAVQNTGRGGSGGEIARAAQREIIRSFLEQGINPAIKDNKGKSVTDQARSESIRQILSGKSPGRGM